MSGLCRVLVGFWAGLCRVYVGFWSGLCRVLVGFMSGFGQIYGGLYVGLYVCTPLHTHYTHILKDFCLSLQQFSTENEILLTRRLQLQEIHWMEIYSSGPVRWPQCFSGQHMAWLCRAVPDTTFKKCNNVLMWYSPWLFFFIRIQGRTLTRFFPINYAVPRGGRH